MNSKTDDQPQAVVGQPTDVPYSIVRNNLMTRPGYTPYCGDTNCRAGMPRTHFINGQFQCACGWRSSFEPEFITAYKEKWAETKRAALSGVRGWEDRK